MLSRSQIIELKDKVCELGDALFYNMSSAPLRIPTSLISASEVDDIGQVWFFIRRPAQHIREFDKEFPVTLHFFRKGKSFCLQVSGEACLVTDPEEINEAKMVSMEIRERDCEQLALVKVKASTIHYRDLTPVTDHRWLESPVVYLTRWLNNQKRKYFPYQYAS